MARTKPMSAVSPKQLLDAENAAINAYQLAYGAMPVPQPGGATIQLCWYGRIERAFDLLANVKGTDKEQTIKGAVQSLIDASKQSQDSAHKAAEHYERLCAESNVTAKDLVPQECSCEFCQSHSLRKGATFARVDLAVSVSSLLMATPGKLPAVVAMVDEIDKGSKEAASTLRTALTGIAEAMRRYSQACEQNGLQPDWRVY